LSARSQNIDLLLNCLLTFVGNPDGTPAKPFWTLPETVAVLRQAYCGTVALEYKHLWQQDEMAWIEERYETRPALTAGEKAGVLRLLLAADYLERFLSQKFPATKRCDLAKGDDSRHVWSWFARRLWCCGCCLSALQRWCC
jgi:hypothetical protein